MKGNILFLSLPVWLTSMVEVNRNAPSCQITQVASPSWFQVSWFYAPSVSQSASCSPRPHMDIMILIMEMKEVSAFPSKLHLWRYFSLFLSCFSLYFFYCFLFMSVGSFWFGRGFTFLCSQINSFPHWYTYTLCCHFFQSQCSDSVFHIMPKDNILGTAIIMWSCCTLLRKYGLIQRTLHWLTGLH